MIYGLGVQNGEADLKIPEKMKSFSWLLSKILFPLSYVVFPVVAGQDMTGRRVHLLTLSAVPTPDHFAHLSAPRPSGNWVDDLNVRTMKGPLSSPDCTRKGYHKSTGVLAPGSWI